ncbi:hypothetical protein Poli38472_011442 [Pythium oligandrum]|uniref:Uncharacterized protein n=1 Tax=Pythium oligandrum TaxID=41045 RepID=A0A8K1FM72_PYTOL|nr:hypothetical protein Poli38472_011442 [Pythium oligandrum]|eukprot:TMW64562.1 hypothetical protein Poli38472_011442 [Pythium oligandrum]
MIKSTLTVACLALALVAGNAAANPSFTYPKCHGSNNTNCCTFGKGKMASPGYFVANLENGPTIVTCSHGKLECFLGNPNLRQGDEARDSIPCPDFTALTEARSSVEVLEGITQEQEDEMDQEDANAADSDE